ncbi:alcohol oxidase [Hortaea werneckii]|nr:alcohol oxidase [Hortaea werneckii]
MSILSFFALCVAPIALSLPINSPLLESYDYIVVGGGPAGLTVANRLSEDPEVNVLLLEAGPADSGELNIALPGMIGHEIGSRYDWNLSTTAQVSLNGAVRTVPQGRGLGGGTLINGMLWNRGGVGDYDAWVQLGNEGWSWEDLLPYFIKSETFTPVTSEELALQFSIEADMDVHGFDGPVQVSFPHYMWNSSAVLFGALNELGVPTAYDPNTGQVAGASFLPLNLQPDMQTRSTARTAYYDPIASRPNLWVSTGQYVTQVIFDGKQSNLDANVGEPEDSTSHGQGLSPDTSNSIYGGGALPVSFQNLAIAQAPPVKRRYSNQLWHWVKSLLRRRRQRPGPPLPARDTPKLKAVGVEFASNSLSSRQTVAANREVILAAGALHSPKLLMLSGVGSAAALERLGLPAHKDLPGVGSNLQDHGQVWCWYPYHNPDYANPTMLTANDTYADDAWSDYWANRTGPLTSSAIDGVAFPSLPLIVNGSTVIADMAAAQSPEQYLPANTDPTVLAGFARQLPLLVDALSDHSRAGYEIINANDGALTVGNMRPLSRGTVTLNSSEPFDPPIIDPRYGSNPVDGQLLVAAMRFNERLLSTNALSQLEPEQMLPPAGSTDAELLTYISTKMQTEYHLAGTCAMLPQELGGVVSPDLLVYGTSNLRVVDSSIMPLLPAAHLQAVVYGVAEKAADIIKAANGATSSSLTSSTFSSATFTLPPTSIRDPVSSTQPVSAVTSMSGESTTQTADLADITTFVTVVQTETIYV